MATVVLLSGLAARQALADMWMSFSPSGSVIHRDGSWRDRGALCDYVVRFRIPRSLWIKDIRTHALSARASRTLSRATVQVWPEGSDWVIEWTAGARARALGGYLGCGEDRDAGTWAKDLREAVLTP